MDAYLKYACIVSQSSWLSCILASFALSTRKISPVFHWSLAYKTLCYLWKSSNPSITNTKKTCRTRHIEADSQDVHECGPSTTSYIREPQNVPTNTSTSISSPMPPGPGQSIHRRPVVECDVTKPSTQCAETGYCPENRLRLERKSAIVWSNTCSRRTTDIP